jgi:hypothetical protein
LTDHEITLVALPIMVHSFLDSVPRVSNRHSLRGDVVAPCAQTKKPDDVGIPDLDCHSRDCLKLGIGVSMSSLRQTIFSNRGNLQFAIEKMRPLRPAEMGGSGF